MKFTLPPNSSFTACHKASCTAQAHSDTPRKIFAAWFLAHHVSTARSASPKAPITHLLRRCEGRHSVSAAVLSACDLHSAPASATTDAPCGPSCSALNLCRVEHASCCSETCQGQSQVPCMKIAAANMLNQCATLLLCLSCTHSANGSRGCHAASDRANRPATSYPGSRP